MNSTIGFSWSVAYIYFTVEKKNILFVPYFFLRRRTFVILFFPSHSFLYVFLVTTYYLCSLYVVKPLKKIYCGKFDVCLYSVCSFTSVSFFFLLSHFLPVLFTYIASSRKLNRFERREGKKEIEREKV